MPKTSASVDMKAHLASEVTTLCTCWEIERKDGAFFRFTDLDQDITISGDVYTAAIGYMRSAMAMNLDFSIDNIEIVGIIDDDQSLNEDDIRAGLFDFAELRMFLANWADPTMQVMKLRRGRLGDVSSTASGVFKTQMNGMVQLLAHTIGEIFTALCGADLGDGRCKIDLTLGAGFTFAGTVTVVNSNRNFASSIPGVVDPDSWFNGGVVTWTSGLNIGRSIEVKQSVQAGQALDLFLPMPRNIQVGDQFTVYPGCDKKAITCRDKFNNILNNRGFPFIPGVDALLQSPSTLT